MQSYKPKPTALEASIIQQNIAKGAGKSIIEMAKLLGYSCGYTWLRAIITELEKE